MEFNLLIKKEFGHCFQRWVIIALSFNGIGHLVIKI